MRFFPTHALFAALAMLVASCGGAQVQAAPPGREAQTPARLYPLGNGYRWSYNIDTGTGVDTLRVMGVVRAEAGHFELSGGGDSGALVYDLRPDGLYRPGSSTWLLHAPIRGPIELGASWPSTSGMTATVTSVTARASTNAGDFANCVEITEAGGEGGRTTRTVYCPDVGPVLIDTSIEMTLAATSLHVTAKLLGFSFGGE